jgi:hypothetical protein
MREQNKANGNGGYRPSKEEVAKETEILSIKIVEGYKKAKSKGFFKMNPP